MARPVYILAAVLATSSAAVAAPGGPLRTLPKGNWQCATPGRAGENAVVVHEELGFKVINPSSYARAGERGTYLNTGTRVVFTSGPMQGMRFERLSLNMIQERLEDGSLGPLRCVRLGA